MTKKELEERVAWLEKRHPAIYELGKRDGRKELQAQLIELLGIKECHHDDD